MNFPLIYRKYRIGRVVQTQQLEINSDDLTSANFHSSQVCLVTTVSKKHPYTSRNFLVQS